MKTFAITDNYRENFSDISGQPPRDTSVEVNDPGWYFLPDSSILRTGNPFFVPDFDTEFQAYPSIALRIGRLGKSISARFAPRYVEAVGAGAAVIATTLLAQLRKKGMPWTQATAFDRSLWLGNLTPPDTLSNLEEIEFSCGEQTIMYRLESLKFDIFKVIELVSATNTLKNGDIILAGLTGKGLSLKPESRFRARTEKDSNLLDIKIK